MKNLSRNRLTKQFGLILAGILLGLSGALYALEDEVWQQVSHNVRVMRHPDGSSTEYRRSTDEKTLTKRRFTTARSGAASTLTSTVYRMDARGNPLRCHIYDNRETLLLTVSYIYHRATGRLVAEDTYDAREPRINPKNGKEIPIRRMYWLYHDAGNVTRGFSFVWRHGDYAEDAFDPSKAHFPTDNPFNEKGAPNLTPQSNSANNTEKPNPNNFAVPQTPETTTSPPREETTIPEDDDYTPPPLRPLPFAN